MSPPTSVEEAGAELGAAITRIGLVEPTVNTTQTSSPAGMHSSFSTSPIPSLELFIKLKALLVQLQSHHETHVEYWNKKQQQNSTTNNNDNNRGGIPTKIDLEPIPLTAAPSILAVLMKLLTLSTSSIIPTNMSMGMGMGGLRKSLSANTLNSHSQHSDGGASTSSNASNPAAAAANSSSHSSHNPGSNTNSQHGHGPIYGGNIANSHTPMVSTALRSVWVECVVLCLILGDHLTGRSRVDIYAFIRKMMELANSNPKSAKAQGGTRLAALQVMSAIYTSPTLAPKLSPWALEILQICLFGLRSGGSNDPTHRLYSITLASSVVYACRISSNKQRHNFLFVQAMEEKALLEAIKIVKRGCEDRLAEVREQAAVLAGLMSNVSMYVQQEIKHGGSSGGNTTNSGGGGGASSGGGGNNLNNARNNMNVLFNPFLYLEEVVQVVMKNMDDENPGVASKWAEALARCLCVSIAYGKDSRQTNQMERNSNRRVEGDDTTTSAGGSGSTSASSANSNNNSSGGSTSSGSMPSDLISKFKNYSEQRRGNHSICAQSSSLSSTLQFLVEQFIKVGGELGASKCGGSFSTGGRAVRVNYAQTIAHLIRLQIESGDIGSTSDGSISTTEVIHIVLQMVGPAMEKYLLPTETLLFIGLIKSVPASPSLLGGMNMSSISMSSLGNNKKSPKDAGIARLCASRILRVGLGELSPELTQISMLRDLATFCNQITTTPSATSKRSPNAHQLQVALGEMSHLIQALGEACASVLDPMLPALKKCIVHYDHGVRYEASTVYASLTNALPEQGSKCLKECLTQVQTLRQSLLDSITSTTSLESKSKPSTLTSTTESNTNTTASTTLPTKEITPTKRRGFRRVAPTAVKTEIFDPSETIQVALHGNTLAVSRILLELPSLSPFGLDANVLDDIVTTAESLIMSIFDESLVQKNPVAACSSVRAGYFLLSSALTIGPSAITKHVELLFHLWNQSSEIIYVNHEKLNKFHQLICLEAFLSSVVAFLRSCSNFLLSVPYALSRITLILEQVLEAVSEGGHFYNKPRSKSAIFFWNSVQVLTMEAYCWLPPGSYPLASEQLFAFAVDHIKMSTAEEISTSLLPSLISSEDRVLDIAPTCRATVPGQVMSSSKVAEYFVALSCNPIDPIERETVLHVEAWKKLKITTPSSSSSVEVEKRMAGSLILGMFSIHQNDHEDETSPPTPLHKVGTWQEPASPMLSIQIRLIDFAILAFAASFGSQENSKKEKVALTFEAMLSSIAQPNSRFNVGSALMSDNDKNIVKTKQEIAVVSNVCTTLFACVKSLPFYEAYIDDKMKMGSPWMTKTSDVLFTMLPSPIYLIRRAAAEGLASLAAVGLTENKHSVQSSILHSLDEVMQGNLPDGTVRKIISDVLISSRAGALLTLACLQRSIFSLLADGKKRSQLRSHAVDMSSISSPPTMIMMTRVLACLSTRAHDGDSMMVRASALHVFGLLTSYSFSTSQSEPGPEQIQILRKAVELVEHNFLSTWTTISAVSDKGSKSEKFEVEPILLTVLIRLITTLLPKLHLIKGSDPYVSSRFCAIVTTIMEYSNYHSAIILEGLAFMEVFSAQVEDMRKGDLFGKTLLDMCIPFLVLKRDRPSLLLTLGKTKGFIFNESTCHHRATLLCLQAITAAYKSTPTELNNLNLHVPLFRLLESCIGMQTFQDASWYKTISVDREFNFPHFGHLEKDITSAIQVCMSRDVKLDESDTQKRLLHWLLFTRSIASGNIDKNESEDVEEEHMTRDAIESFARKIASRDVLGILDHAAPSRWQVKLQAIQIACFALSEIAGAQQSKQSDSPHFSPSIARNICTKICREISTAFQKPCEEDFPNSYVALHLEELMSAACVTSIATSDHAELRTLQNSGIELLLSLIVRFGEELDPDETSTSVLQQFTSQIVSSIKHGIDNTLNDSGNESTVCCGNQDLFLSACKAIQLITKLGLVSDPIVLRRLIRPLLSPETEMRPFPKSEEDIINLKLRSDNSSGNIQLALSRRLGCLSTLADLSLSSNMGTLPEAVGQVIPEETKNNEIFNAIHCGSLSLDAARIIFENNSSGDNVASSGEKDGSFHAGLTFANSKDIGSSFPAYLMKVWPSLAAYSVTLFSKKLNQQGITEEKRMHIMDWLENMVPLLFKAIYDSVSNLDKSQEQLKVISYCIYGLRKLITQVPSFGHKFTGFTDEVGHILTLLSQKITFIALGIKTDNIVGNELETMAPKNLIFQTCAFMEDLCVMYEQNESGMNRDILMKVVFTPLNAWQAGLIPAQVHDNTKYQIITSCLRAAQVLVTSSASKEDEQELLNAMIHLCVSVLVTKCENESLYSALKEAATALLKTCINSTSISLSMKQSIAKEAARVGSWDAWATVCSNLEDDSGIAYSIDMIKETLNDEKDIDRHAAALMGLRIAIQDRNSILVPLMQNVGGSIINLLRLHGLCQASGESSFQRTTIIADAVRIAMLSLQQLISPGPGISIDDSDFTAFLELLFGVMVEVIEFNGLPNKLKSDKMSDPAIGRMCAQAILHAVKSCPVPSKSAIANMNPEDRSALELAVRAEMTGYSNFGASGPTKKKLTLQKFTKV